MVLYFAVVVAFLLCHQPSAFAFVSPSAPSIANKPETVGSTWLLAWRIGTGRIALATSVDGENFSPPFVPLGTLAITDASPSLFVFPNLGLGSPFQFWLFWVDSTTRQIFFSFSPTGTAWAIPAAINSVDTTSDTPVASFVIAPNSKRFICVEFRGRTTSNIFMTCSETGIGGSWPRSTKIPGVTTTTGPTATFFPQSLLLSETRGSLLSFRANDPSARIFVIQNSQSPLNFASGTTLVQPFCCTNFSPFIVAAVQPGTNNTNAMVFWVDRTTSRIRFGISIDNGITWAGPFDINGVDTTKDQVSVASGRLTTGRDIICVHFLSNDSLNQLRVTCSTTGFPGSFPVSIVTPTIVV